MKLLAFILIGCFWGGSFPAITLVVEQFPPLFAAWLRVTSSLFFLGLIFLVMRQSVRIPLRSMWKVWIAGLFFQGIPFCFLYWGEQVVPGSIASIINGTVPLWTSLFSALFLKGDELFTSKKIFGLSLGFLGILFIYGPHLQLGMLNQEILGLSAIVIVTLCYGIGTVLNRRIITREAQLDFRASLFHQHIASVTFLSLVFLLIEGVPAWEVVRYSHKALIATGYLAFFSTTIAWLLFFHLLKTWGSVRTTAVAYIIPIVAMMVDYILFRHVPTLSAVLGAITILLGTFLIQNKFVFSPRKAKASTLASPIPS